MKAPRILLSGSDGSRINYENAIRRAGGIPCSFYCPPVSTDYDGLLLCGGEDVDPSYFHQENRGSRDMDLRRDQAEFPLVAAWLAAEKPIFGICRGHQVLNIALGGTLVQDIGPEPALFHTHDSHCAGDKVHPVRAAAGYVLHRFYGPIFPVNSSHHQVVDRLGTGLRATAWSESGLVEGMEHDTLPLLCVQFHPERMSYDRRRPDTADGSFLFEHFIQLCRGGCTGW